MGDAGASAESPSIWAIPIAPDTIALWCELAAGAVDVALAPDGAASELLFKRRLITRGRRLHVFVFRKRDFSVSAPCSIAFRPERGRPMSRFRSPPGLAQWSTASVTAVVHAIIEGSRQAGEDLSDMRLLSRFLSLTSSWAVPCRVLARGADVCAAAFAFAHGLSEPTTIVAAAAGSLTLQRVIPVPHGRDSTCILWQGDPFDRAFLEHEGSLLELKLDDAAVPLTPLAPWFASLEPRQQDGIMDGFRLVLPDDDTASVEALGRHLPHDRTFALGHRDIEVAAVISLGSEVCVALRADAGADLSLTLTPFGEADAAVTTRIQSEAPAKEGSVVLSRSIRIGSAVAHGSPVRVTLGVGGIMETRWLSALGLEAAAARRWMRATVDWERVDEALVRNVGGALARIEPEPFAPPPAAVALSSFEAGDEAALLLCRYTGDLQSLRSTLIAFALTPGEFAVRIVTQGRLALRAVLDLRDLCQSLRLPAALVTLEEGMPFSDALRRGERGGPQRALLLADSGLAPLEADWWQRVLSLLAKDPALLCYGFPAAHLTEQETAYSYLRASAPLVIAGPRISEEVLPGGIELQTYEGMLHHALGAAERAGCAEHLPWLRLTASPLDAKEMSFGAVRLDEAVAAAASMSPTRDTPQRASNLVQLAARAVPH